MSDRNQKKIRQKAQDFADEKKKELMAQVLTKIYAMPFHKRCLVAWSILFPKKPVVWEKGESVELVDKQAYDHAQAVRRAQHEEHLEEDVLSQQISESIRSKRD